jgi:1,2-diacylglycerol 3-alpha-glucosyltransferase
MSKLKVFFVCTGLGNVQRGYETFSRECFDNLTKTDIFDITLFKGGGETVKREIKLWNLQRNWWFSFQLSRIIGRLTGKGGTYFIEALSFFVSLIPQIFIKEPDIVYFCDEPLGDFLWNWKNMTGAKYKLLFHNGAPSDKFNNLERWDHIAPTHFQIASNWKVADNKQTLIPCGSSISPQLQMLTVDEQKQLCGKLNLPTDRQIVLCVGAINSHHKRIDYLIQEFSILPNPRPYLVMLGHQDHDSYPILQMAEDLLGNNNYTIRTVSNREVKDYYKIADVFVLPSLQEDYLALLMIMISRIMYWEKKDISQISGNRET